MDKFLIDFNRLDTKINGPKVYKLADVQDKIQKVAFDVVRFRDNEDTNQLWRIEESADGPVIVAMYESSPEDPKIAEASATSPKTDWGAIADSGTHVNVLYKGEAIKTIAASKLGLDDVHLLCKWLPQKLASDKDFRSSLVKDMPRESRDLLLSKYPELRG